MRHLVILMLLSASLSAQYYYKSFSELNDPIQINFTRFTSAVSGWNHVDDDPTVAGQKKANLFDSKLQSTGFSLWVDSASNTSNHYVSAQNYPGWPGAVTSRAWRADNGDFTIAIRGMSTTETITYTITLYTSHQTYHNQTVFYTVNGVVHEYTVNSGSPDAYTLTTSNNASGEIIIRVSSPGLYATLAAMTITQL